MMRKFEIAFAIAAGLFGASGIGLFALSAHVAQNSSLQSAAIILLVHAPALIAVLAAIRSGLYPHGAAVFGALVLTLGALLFSSDLTLRTFMNMPLFPYAAPTGGILMISAWLILAVTGIFIRRPA